MLLSRREQKTSFFSVSSHFYHRITATHLCWIVKMKLTKKNGGGDCPMNILPFYEMNIKWSSADTAMKLFLAILSPLFWCVRIERREGREKVTLSHTSKKIPKRKRENYHRMFALPEKSSFLMIISIVFNKFFLCLWRARSSDAAY